jgi:hypothetical protein
MFIFKLSNSFVSFSLKLLFLISGILFKIFFSDILLLESGDLIDQNDQDSNSDQSFKDKIKNLP